MASNLLAEAHRRVTTQLEQLQQDRASLMAFSKLVTLGFSAKELAMMFRGYQLWSQLPNHDPVQVAEPPTEDKVRQAFEARVRVLFPGAAIELTFKREIEEVVIYTGLPATVLYQGPLLETPA